MYSPNSLPLPPIRIINKIVYVWLMQANQWGGLANRFDLTSIAAGGHSFGGATAFSASVNDDRVCNHSHIEISPLFQCDP
jgi:hypothetical protein